MDDFNSIVLEGNIVRNPEFRETGKGTPVCTFSIAVNKSFRTTLGERRQEVSFFDIETWGNLATSCSRYCSKGRGIRVVGRLKQNRWQDTEGKNHSKIKIVAEHVDFKPRFSNTKEKPTETALGGNAQQELADLAEVALANHQELCEAVF